jgi:hypothetical protein
VALLSASKEKAMSVEILDPRYDAVKQEMRFAYPFVGQANATVCVPYSAMVQGEEWVKARIKGWFIDHDRPEPGTTLRIEDWQFDINMRQPEMRSDI